MRFISREGRLQVLIRPLIREEFATGGSRTLQEQVMATFLTPQQGGDLRPHERELALAVWQFEGSFQELDEVTTVPPDHRIGVFDSVATQQDRGWPDELREEVDQNLSNLARRFNHILVAPLTSVPPPWPKYDEYRGAPKSLVRKLADEGHDLDRTLLYEREMQNRPEVVHELELALGLIKEEEKEEVVLG